MRSIYRVFDRCTSIAFHTSFILTTIPTGDAIIKSSFTNEEPEAQRGYATSPRPHSYSDSGFLTPEPDLLTTVSSHHAQQGKETACSCLEGSKE